MKHGQANPSETVKETDNQAADEKDAASDHAGEQGCPAQVNSVLDAKVTFEPGITPSDVIKSAEMSLGRAIIAHEEMVTLPCAVLMFVLQELRRRQSN